jgi:prephenate dehydratase
MNPSHDTTTPDRAGPRVAFQGELGAFSDEAVRAFFGASAEPVACRTFDAVARAVVGGEVDFGLLPIENSLAGSVVGSYDVLAATDLVVLGETVRPIHHCVLGVPGAGLETLRRVLSHPVALAQCTRFFEGHPDIEPVSHYDTAGAAREVAQLRDPSVGAIASRLAAERYRLEILAADVEDRPDNQTRFLAVSRPGHPHPARREPGADDSPGFRTSLLAETDNRPGALVRLLLPFADHGVNLSKLESRPGGEPWTYRFFIEVDTAVDAPAAAAALQEARRHATALRVLGSYPRWTS